MSGMMSFNPRPPIKAGESRSEIARLEREAVSIRAHQLRRANPNAYFAEYGHSGVSIRAHQLRRANRSEIC